MFHVVGLLALSSVAAAGDVEVRAIPLRTELVVGEPLVLCIQVQNISDRPIELSRHRAMSAMIFVREAGTEAFEPLGRGRHYREGLEVDGTDAWPPKMQWSWDEWVVRRTDAEGNANGLVFDRPGTFEVKVTVRLDHLAVHSRGWQDTNVVKVSVEERRDKHGNVVPAPGADVQRLLEGHVQSDQWREEIATLESLDGELRDYGQFRIGERCYFTAMGWRSLEPRWHVEFKSAESVARRSVQSFTKMTDRCPGLRYRAALRMVPLLIGYPATREGVNFESLLKDSQLRVAAPDQPLDRLDMAFVQSGLRRLGILFVEDVRLDIRIRGTFGKNLTWTTFWGRVCSECDLAVRLPDEAKNAPFQELGAIDTPLRELLFRFSFSNQWWECHDGVVTYVADHKK